MSTVRYIDGHEVGGFALSRKRMKTGLRNFTITQWQWWASYFFKSSGVTLLPLLVKETRYFYSVTHFSLYGSVTVTSYGYFKCNSVVTSYYKK